jgi:hypothetical protein
MSIENRIAIAKDLIRKREEIDQRLSELFGGQLPKRQKRAAPGSAEHAGHAPVQEPAAEEMRRQGSTLTPSPFAALSRLAADESGDVL